MPSIDGSRQPQDRRDWFDRLEACTRAVNRLFAAAACLLVLVIMTAIMIQVVYRFLLDDPIAWVLDITIFLLVFVFFLAVAPALQSSSHIEVDMFDSLIPKRHHKAVRLIGKLLTVAFGAIFLWYVAAFYYDIVELDEVSFTMLIVQLKYVYWIGPLGAAQFLLTSIVLLIRFWRDPLKTDVDMAMVDAS
jgi:TRAP-type C4-dicarboxylate transport system permease small subunit